MRFCLRAVLVLTCGHLLGGCSYDYDKLGGQTTDALSRDGGAGAGESGGRGAAGAGAGSGGFVTGVAGAGGGASAMGGAGGGPSKVTGSGGEPSGTGGTTVPVTGVAGSGGGSGGSSGIAGAGGAHASGGSPGAGGGAGAGGAHPSGGSPGTAGTGGAAGGGDPDLVLWYKFDETSGQTAADSSGFAGGPRNANLGTAGTGGACGFSSSIYKVGTGAASMTGNGVAGGGYVAVPSLYSLVPDAVTIASWVYTSSSSQYQRIFDFGNDTTTFMFLAIADTSTFVRFAITSTGTTAEQRIQTSTTLSLNAWHHVALVLAGGNPHVGTIYVDGAPVATTILTLGVHDLGATTNNYLGRSQFSTDSYLTGEIDDFRVYRRALTPLEITTIYGLR